SHQTIRYLAWIAKQLSLHNQVEFYPERMQLDWLPKTWTRQLHNCAVLGLVYGLLTGVLFGLLNLMLYGPAFSLLMGVARGLLTGLVYWIVNGISYAVLDRFANQEGQLERRTSLGRRIQQFLILCVRSGWVLALACGTANALLNVFLLRPFLPPHEAFGY